MFRVIAFFLVLTQKSEWRFRVALMLSSFCGQLLMMLVSSNCHIDPSPFWLVAYGLYLAVVLATAMRHTREVVESRGRLRTDWVLLAACGCELLAASLWLAVAVFLLTHC